MKFVHIPKTAGQSIYFTYPELEWGHFDKNLIALEKNYYDTFHVHDHLLMKDLYKDEITFCVVRNPIDRLISAYKFRGYMDHIDIFNDTIKKWNIELQLNPWYLNNHLRPQYFFAEWCTHIIKYENLDYELGQLLQNYGIRKKKLLKKNQSGKYYKNISKDSISKENMSWILDYYKKDFDLYYK